ncbi:protein of unknown function [Lactiplantibacillus plantarum]
MLKRQSNEFNIGGNGYEIEAKSSEYAYRHTVNNFDGTDVSRN